MADKKRVTTAPLTWNGPRSWWQDAAWARVAGPNRPNATKAATATVADVMTRPLMSYLRLQFQAGAVVLTDDHVCAGPQIATPPRTRRFAMNRRPSRSCLVRRLGQSGHEWWRDAVPRGCLVTTTGAR